MKLNRPSIRYFKNYVNRTIISCKKLMSRYQNSKWSEIILISIIELLHYYIVSKRMRNEHSEF